MTVIIVFQQTEDEGQTLSVLKFIPSIEDDGKYLTCRAENPSIADSTIEDKWLLNVECKLHLCIYYRARSGSGRPQ